MKKRMIAGLMAVLMTMSLAACGSSAGSSDASGTGSAATGDNSAAQAASGDKVTFVVENGSVRLINSAVYAMQMLQAQMAGEAENSGLTSDEADMDLIKEVRAESEL